jgi:hypothetical protein
MCNIIDYWFNRFSDLYKKFVDLLNGFSCMFKCFLICSKLTNLTVLCQIEVEKNCIFVEKKRAMN